MNAFEPGITAGTAHISCIAPGCRDQKQPVVLLLLSELQQVGVSGRGGRAAAASGPTAAAGGTATASRTRHQRREARCAAYASLRPDLLRLVLHSVTVTSTLIDRGEAEPPPIAHCCFARFKIWMGPLRRILSEMLPMLRRAEMRWTQAAATGGLVGTGCT
jgi:hypothetical protein